MFAKLLKHEWKATWGILGVLSLCALGASAVGALMIRLLQTQAGEEFFEPFQGVMIMMLMFIILGLVVYYFGANLVLYHRFYKNKFTDEGYLTFTLPAKSWQILLASMVNIAIWMVIITVVLGAGIVIMLGIGLAEQWEEIWELEKMIFEGLDDIMDMTAQLVSSAISAVANIAVVLCCITVGATIAKKHKILAAIGIYYGASVLQNMISSILMAFVLFDESVNSVEQFGAQMNALTICSGVMYLAFGVGAFFLANHLIDRKLNLP